MKTIAQKLLLTLSSALLLAAATMLLAHPLEYCGQPETLRLRVERSPISEACRPTLAPPHKVVVVNVQADWSGLEVGWAGD